MMMKEAIYPNHSYATQ